MADMADSKSAARKSVWVQVPISAPETFERMVVEALALLLKVHQVGWVGKLS